MGFFSRLFGGGDDTAVVTEGGTKAPSGAVARLQKKVSNKYVQGPERTHAIDALAEIGTEEAVNALLQRFTFRIDQSIGDEEEKQQVCNHLVRLGTVSVTPICAFLERENAPYWPIKALREIVGDDETIGTLLRIEGAMEAIFDRDVERKVELVSNLREFKDERVRERLLGLLSDDNEELRVHALEGLADLGQEEMGNVLVDRLLDDSETQRVRTAILNLLVEKSWKLKHRKDQLRKVIPEGFWVDDVGVIHRR